MSSNRIPSTSTDATFVGYPTRPAVAPRRAPFARTLGERTLLGRVESEAEGEVVLLDDHAGLADGPRFTSDMMAQLRARLRQAEQAEEAEASGVFERTEFECAEESGLCPAQLGELEEVAPTVPEATLESGEVPVLALREAEPVSPDLMASFGALSVDAADSLLAELAPPASELDDLVAAVPELEASLAPNSDSNFYAGFDEQHPDGVFLATYEILPEGTPVYLDVVLPAGYRFRTPATVEWQRAPIGDSDRPADPELPCGMGLKMCGLDDAMRGLIRAYAQHRKPIFWVG